MTTTNDKTHTTPAYGNEKTAMDVIVDLRQKITCLTNALEECDQIVVQVYEKVQHLVNGQAGYFMAQVQENALSICRQAQDDMRARIRDATGERT